MKIKETKTNFIAICTEEREKETCFLVGDCMAKISKKTGKFIGATACMLELNEAYNKSLPKVVKKSFKIWVVIEEQTMFEDGSEEYKDLEDNVQSAGHFDTLEEAEAILNEINKNYEGDFRD
jgi:hypothetical protein